jgi:hypothetical protein
VAHSHAGRPSSAPPSRRTAFALACLAGVLAASAPAPTASASPAPAAPAAPAGDVVDFLVMEVEVNQQIQTGSTSLVAGRPTFVRAMIRVAGGAGETVPVDGLLRVFVDGVESAGSPVWSDNGPFPASVPNPAVEDGTLNFVFLPPASADVVLQVHVNPPGPNHAPEADALNNTLSTAPLSFGVQGVPELAYAPIDYRPSGGPVPNPPDPVLIEPGMGDNFVQGIYPTADWDYHRTDAPSKLWTSSLSSSGSGLLNSLEIDIELMVPRPDFLYGWVPGGLPYNGQSVIGGDVSMGNTEPIRYQRTFAHELGHNFGLFHNSVQVGVIGVDVEHHLALTQALPQIKASNLNDIMVAGLLTHQAWVASGTFQSTHGHPAFDAGAGAEPGGAAGPAFIVAGLLDTLTGGVQLTHVLGLPSARPSAPAAPGETDLVLRGHAGGTLVTELPVAVRHTADAAVQPTLLGFTAILPAPGAAPFDRLELVPAGGAGAGAGDAAGAVVLQRSAAAPVVAFTAPAGPLAEARVTVSWTADDADGDALAAWLRYSSDGEAWAPVASAVGIDPVSGVASVEVDLTRLPAPVEGRAAFDVLVSDGLHTTRAVSDPLHGTGSIAALGGNAPWVAILSPDAGTSWLRGATVILHSSGWDLEDRSLSGDAIVWTSSLDGTIGTGRVTSVDTLSAGTHVISATATDSHGMASVDAHVIDVLDRDLPTLDETCQTDLGMGGPGSAELSVCGGDLSQGTSAALLLAGAPASTSVWLVAGTTSTPTPYKGGTLVPDASLVLGPVSTDASGELAATVPGGSGPVTLYVQALLVDGSQPLGFGLSNAVRIDLLP